jgi:hypothetical protein
VRAGRLGDCVIHVGAPNRAKARAILAKHLPADVPYDGASGAAEIAETRDEILDAATTRLFGANAGAPVAVAVLRDSRRVTIKPADLVNGALLAKVARAAIERALVRDLEQGEPGLRRGDVLDVIDAELASLAGLLTPANCRTYVARLPEDNDVVAVHPAGADASSQLLAEPGR